MKYIYTDYFMFMFKWSILRQDPGKWIIWPVMIFVAGRASGVLDCIFQTPDFVWFFSRARWWARPFLPDICPRAFIPAYDAPRRVISSWRRCSFVSCRMFLFTWSFSISLWILSCLGFSILPSSAGIERVVDGFVKSSVPETWLKKRKPIQYVGSSVRDKIIESGQNNIHAPLISASFQFLNLI